MLNQEQAIAAHQSTTEAEIREHLAAQAAGIDPAEIETIVSLVLKYGPAIYQTITGLFHKKS